jgi:DNA (cytosine-5)-methyltransferase 1
VTMGGLFSGVGGFELGFERAGFDVRWMVEIDPFCRAVLKKHWPRVRCYDDIRTAWGLERVDVICGGWPCQPVSSASRGRRLGTADHRWLWPATARAVDELRPTWFVPACAFGLDHRRSRLWILGHTNRNGQPVLSLNAEVAGMPRRGDDSGSVGTADGISRGLDANRMAALGNAIVPQIAEWIAKQILKAEGRAA